MTKPADGRGRDRTAAEGGPEYLFGSVMSTPVRLAYGLGPVIQVLEEHGHAVTPLLKAAEIPRFALEEPSYRIRLEQETRFTRLALERLQLPAAGLVVGQRYHLAMFGILGLAAACAPTLRELFRTMLSYPVLAWSLIEVSVWRERGEGFLALDESSDVSGCGPFFVERDMTCALTLFRDTLGPHVVPASIRFRHLPPPDPEPYEDFFGCEVLFGKPVNEMRFAADFWDSAPPQANEMSHRFFENQCRRVSDMLLEPLDYADIVMSRLRSATPIPSLPVLAAALQLTERTLQRRLAAEDTSFSVLLRAVRIERARELLRRGNVMFDEIAYRLGFQDAVAFSRAFKEWTGTSPRAFRRTSGIRGPGN
jgi:AraC-like DNA-binding protein